MRVRRRPKSRKVRHSLGRNLSRSLKSTSPIKNNHGAAAAHNSGISHEKRRSSKKLRRLMRKKGMKRNTSKLLEVYSTLDSRNSAVKKKRGLSKGLAQNADDIPSTSQNAAAATKRPNSSMYSPGVKFKKFSDDLTKTSMRRSQHRSQRFNSTSNSSTASQIAKRKLLKSIRRRQNCKFTNNTKQSNMRFNTERNFNFPPDKISDIKQYDKTTINENVTLEEGEILGDNDITLKAENNVSDASVPKADDKDTKINDQMDVNNVESGSEEDSEEDSEEEHDNNDSDDSEVKCNDDDKNECEDCVYVAPKVDLITIDDENDEQTALSQSEMSKLTDFPTKSQMITSTPIEKVKGKTNTGLLPLPDEKPPLFFFEDTSCTKMYETITSMEGFTDYSHACSILRPGKRKKSRRSRRLEEKDQMTVVVDVPQMNDDCILVDDSTLKPTKEECSDVDDSVIFVSDTNPNRMAFIPLEADDVPNPIPYTCPPRGPRTRSQNPSGELFTKSEKEQLNVYNGNTYNPNAGDQEKKTAGKRMVLIDGCNVAFNHSLKKSFSVKGLKICLDYFEKMGHEVKAIVPQFRLNRHKSTDPEEMSALHSAGKIVLTPCKNLPDIKSASYDDRFILQLACELDAAIVSNDNYRDLLNENSAFKKIIENRVIGYTWCNDIFILPKDPYGKWGPDLNTILNRA